jgi:hypothetical protein
MRCMVERNVWGPIVPMPKHESLQAERELSEHSQRDVKTADRHLPAILASQETQFRKTVIAQIASRKDVRVDGRKSFPMQPRPV